MFHQKLARLDLTWYYTPGSEPELGMSEALESRHTLKQPWLLLSNLLFHFPKVGLHMSWLLIATRLHPCLFMLSWRHFLCVCPLYCGSHEGESHNDSSFSMQPRSWNSEGPNEWMNKAILFFLNHSSLSFLLKDWVNRSSSCIPKIGIKTIGVLETPK